MAAADAEGLNTFAIAGFSLGGPIAIRAAVRHPKRVNALVLTATFAHRDSKLDLAAAVWQRLYESGDRSLLAGYLTLVALSTPALKALTPDQLRAGADLLTEAIPPGIPVHTGLVRRIDVRDDLARITAPPWGWSAPGHFPCSASPRSSSARTSPASSKRSSPASPASRSVTRSVGDEVYGMPFFPRAGNAYAEYVAVPSRQLARKPAAVDHAHAAALPLAGLTAWQSIVGTAQVQAGQRVLIHGGGVGHLSVQIARARGAHVIAMPARPSTTSLAASARTK